MQKRKETNSMCLKVLYLLAWWGGQVFLECRENREHEPDTLEATSAHSNSHWEDTLVWPE